MIYMSVHELRCAQDSWQIVADVDDQAGGRKIHRQPGYRRGETISRAHGSS